MSQSKLLTTLEAAVVLHYAPTTLRTSRITGVLGGCLAPKFIKRGSKVFYAPETLDDWIDKNSKVFRNTTESRAEG